MISAHALQKRQLKVRMCCAKCEEKVLEEIWEASGVFDVKAWRTESKVVVTAMPMPIGLNECQVLRRARKIDCKARFVNLDPDPPPPIKNGPYKPDPPPPPITNGPNNKPGPTPPPKKNGPNKPDPPEKCTHGRDYRPWPPYCPPWPPYSQPWPQYCGPSWPSPSNPEPPASCRRAPPPPRRGQPLPADCVAPFYLYLLILLVLMLLIFSK